MKNKKTILFACLTASVPMVWWIIYLLLYNVAKTQGLTESLQFSCLFSGLISTIVFGTATVISLDEKK